MEPQLFTAGMMMARSSMVSICLGLLTSACLDAASIVIEPLRIINWSPSVGASCVGVDSSVSATFSDDLVSDSLSDSTFHLTNAAGDVPGTVQYDGRSFSAGFAPDEPLAFGELYTITATSGINSINHGRLAAAVEASFVTVRRNGCTAEVECSLSSDCPGTQICANTGMCADECVADRDCWRGRCDTGECAPLPASDRDGDQAGGDPSDAE